MSVSTAMCTSFKQELLQKVHNVGSDTLKIALIKASPSGTYGAATTNFSDVTGNSDEASGTGYSSGGQNLDSAAITVSGTTALVDFADEVFSDVTLSASGCIIYNSSASNKAIATISFGGTVSATAGDLTIEFPAVGASTSIIRIA